LCALVAAAACLVFRTARIHRSLAASSDGGASGAAALAPFPPPVLPILYGDSVGSERMLLREAQRPRETAVRDAGVDPEAERDRCRRYGLGYSNRTARRRVFYGGSIADDPWAALAAQGIEHRDVFHAVVFAESNRTPTLASRDWRFGDGSENLRALRRAFGDETLVHVDRYVQEGGWPRGYGFEGQQQGAVIRGWKERGMTEDDVGFLGDPDELMTRDFVRAMQICDVREFDDHRNCNRARLSGSMSVAFEGAPGCLTLRSFRKPGMTIGRCIEGINANPSLHAKPERTWKGIGWLSDGYGPPSYHKLPSNTTHYPLYNAHDFRRVAGAAYRGGGYGQTAFHGHTAFHVHNFFSNPEVIRRKYLTYGEARKDASSVALGKLEDDVQTMVDCALNRTRDPGKQVLFKGALASLSPRPRAFEVKGYAEARMHELRELLQLESNI